MALPIVEGSIVATPGGGPKMDSSAFRRAALAPGKIAQSIGENVGGLFQDVSTKIQANKNARTVFEADLAMRKTKDDFTSQLHSMPDETTWLPQYKDRVQALRESVMSGPNVGPDVRRALNQKFDVWEAATTAEVRTAALLKGAKETRESAIADATYAAHQGDLEGANNALNAAVAHYAMSPADAKKISQRFPTISAQAQADTIIASNPIQAPEMLSRFEGKIEPRVYVALQTRATAAKHRAQSDNLNQMAMDMDASPDGTIDPGLVKAKVQTGEITQRGADSLMARMSKSQAKDAKDNHAILMMRVDDHDWVDDKTPEKFESDIRSDGAALPPALRKSLYEHMQSRMNSAKKEGKAIVRPVEEQILSQMSRDRTEGSFIPSGPLGKEQTTYEHIPGGVKALKEMKPEDVQAKFGKSLDAVMEDEKLHYAKMVQAMREWFNQPENQGADIDKANAYRMQLEKPFVMAAAKASIYAPTKTTTPATIDELLRKYGR